MGLRAIIFALTLIGFINGNVGGTIGTLHRILVHGWLLGAGLNPLAELAIDQIDRPNDGYQNENTEDTHGVPLVKSVYWLF